MEIYILKIDLSSWALYYMISKGTSHTSVPNSTYEVQKFQYNPISLLVVQIWKQYSPKERITNFQEWNLIFPNDGWKISVPFRTTKACSPYWNLAKYSFVWVARVWIQSVNFVNFHDVIIESHGLIPVTGFWKYINELWEWVLATSLPEIT